jgi:hypothetical protein
MLAQACAARWALGPDGIIVKPGDALDMFEFEPAARKAVLSRDAPARGATSGGVG